MKMYLFNVGYIIILHLQKHCKLFKDMGKPRQLPANLDLL